jgi:hypothetical protein
MPTVPEIKARISLDGAARVIADLDKATEAGKRAAKVLNTPGGSKIADDQLKAIGLRSLEGETAAKKLHAAFNVLRPALGAAGIGMGRFGAFAAAARLGVEGLSVALAGTLVAALANAGAEAERTRKRIEGVYGPLAPKAIEQAKQGAKETGRGTEEFAGAMEGMAHLSYLRGPQPGGMIFPERKEGTNEPWTPPPGSAVAKAFAQNISSVEGQKAFLTGFDELLRGTGATPEAAAKARDALTQGWTKQAEAGKPALLTQDMVREIYAASPEAARRLAGGLGATSPVTGAPSEEQLELMIGAGHRWQPEDVAGAVGMLAPQAKIDFDARQRSLGEGFSAIKNRAVDQAEPVASPVGTAASWFMQSLGDSINRDNRLEPGGPGTAINDLRQGKGLFPIPTEGPGAPQGTLETAVANTLNLTKQYADTGTLHQPPAPPVDWVKAMGEHPNGQNAAALLDRAATTFAAGVKEFLSASHPTGAPPSGQGAVQRPSTPATASSAPVVPEPFAQGAGSGLIAPASSAPAPAAALTPPTPSRQTATVLRDPNTGEVRVIQPDQIQGQAEGGPIIFRGPGTGTSDSILASLRPGGFVLNAKATDFVRQAGLADGGEVLARVSNRESYFPPESVKKIGADRLALLNALGHYDDGGLVSEEAKEAALKKARYKAWLTNSLAPTQGNIIGEFARMTGGKPVPGAFESPGLQFPSVFFRALEPHAGGGLVPGFADGGLIDGDPSRHAEIISQLSAACRPAVPGLDSGGEIDIGSWFPQASRQTSLSSAPEARGSSEPSGHFHFHAADGRVAVGRVTGKDLVEALSREATSEKEDRAMISPSWMGA